MSTTTNLHATGDRIEALITELRDASDAPTVRKVEELLKLVTDLYGAGLAHVLEIAAAGDVVERLAHDDLIAGLLCLHGLHPEPLSDRVESALETVRPLLAAHGGGVELLAVDGEAAAIRLRLTGSCDGCPSSAMTLQHAVEEAVLRVAPEIATIDVDERSTEPAAVPIMLGSKHLYEACPSELVEQS